MAKLNEINVSENKKILLYGQSGAGKTIAAAGFPGPIYIADFDGKVSSAASFYKGTPQADMIEYDRYSGRADFNKFWTKFTDLRTRAANPESFPYKTLVVDSITTFADSLMNEVMRQNPGEESKRGKVSDTTVPHLKDYQIAIKHIKNTISTILAFPCNVVMTGHIAIDKDELTGEISRQPLIFGKDLPSWLPMVFEEVYYCYVDQKTGTGANPVFRYMAQARGPKYVCRTQISKLPANFELSYTNLKSFF